MHLPSARTLICASLLTILLQASDHKGYAYAAPEGTPARERMEQGGNASSISSSEAQNHIEALEQKVLGTKGHENLETYHVLVESHPAAVLTALAVAIAAIVLSARWMLRRRRTKQ